MLQFFRKYRLVTFAVTALILFSSAGVAMDMHFCQNELKGVKLIGAAKTCHEKAVVRSCHKEVQPENNAEERCQNNCCSHEVVYAQLDTDALTSNSATAEIPFLVANTLLPVLTTASILSSPDASADHLEYKPPQLRSDIPVLIQVFRI